MTYLSVIATARGGKLTVTPAVPLAQLPFYRSSIKPPPGSSSIAQDNKRTLLLLLSFFLLLSPSSSSPLPNPQLPPPSTASPTPSSPTSPTTTTGTGSNKTLPLYIVVAVCAALFVGGAAYVMWKRKFWIKIFSPHPTSPSPPIDTLIPLPSNATSDPTPTPSPSTTTTNLVTRPPVTGVSERDRPVTDGTASQRRRRRRRRRSQDSVVGLPIYSEDPADEEMTLFKHRTLRGGNGVRRSRRQPRDGTSGVTPPDSEHEPDTEDEETEGEGGARAVHVLPYGSTLGVGEDPLIGRPSMDSDRVALIDAETGEAAAELGHGRDRSATASTTNSDRPSIVLPEGIPPSYLYATSSTSLALTPSISPSQPTSIPTTPSRIHHRPSNSSPIIPSSPNLTPPSSSPPVTRRSRASTLRSIFTRSGSEVDLPYGGGSGARERRASNVSLAGIGRSPYGQWGGRNSQSSSRILAESTTSINSMNISEPLRHTLVSSSFVFPKAGLTPQQVAFISSRESLGAFGYGPGAEPVPAFEGPPNLAPPQMEEVNRTPSIVSTRGRRSSSVVSTSSPLAFSSSTNTSPILVREEEELDQLVRNGSVRDDEEDGSQVSTVVPLPAPVPTATPTAASPRLPAINLHIPTPVQSVANSPILPSEDSDDRFPSGLEMDGQRRRMNNVSTISEASFVSAISERTIDSFATATG